MIKTKTEKPTCTSVSLMGYTICSIATKNGK